MLSRKQWRDELRRNPTKAFRKIQGRLYDQMQETIEFLYVASDLMVEKQLSMEFLERIRTEASMKFYELDRARAAKVLDAAYGPMSDKGIESSMFLISGESIRVHGYAKIFSTLLDVLDEQTAVLAIGTSTVPSSFVAILSIMCDYIRSGSPLWMRILEDVQRTKQSILLRRFFEACQIASRTVRIKRISEFEDGDVLKDGLYIEFPAPMHLYSWILNEYRSFRRVVQEQDEIMRLATKEMRCRIDWYRERYQSMWLDMQLRPKWGLRTGNLDCVSIDVPALRSQGIQLIRFEAIGTFPEFRATFHVKKMYTGESIYMMDFAPTSLCDEQVILEEPTGLAERCVFEGLWFGRMLAFICVQAVWEIVMGKHAPKQEMMIDGQESAKNGAVIRPRFRTLPQGQRASLEARERALAVMNAAPLPGFTFVRQHQRGRSAPQSSSPLFTVSQLCAE